MEQFCLMTAVLLIMMGLYMTAVTRGLPLRPLAVLGRLSKLGGSSKKERGAPFRALATALAGSVGTGNIAGVAAAVAIGGPGSIFWMWVSGVLGMATKYGEILIAMRHRVRREDGTYAGGAMYVIERTMGRCALPLASMFALFASLASLGTGNMVQVNTIASAVSDAARAFGSSLDTRIIGFITGAVTAGMLASVIFGGARSTGSLASVLVPLMSLGYIAAAGAVIWMNRAALPGAILSILRGAFGFRQALGGVAGFTMGRALRVGMSRGVFSNEAGMGSAPMAYCASPGGTPGAYAALGIVEVFVDTILICTLTALMVLTSGVALRWGDANVSGMGIALDALTPLMGVHAAGIFLAACAALFAFTAMLGWSLYGSLAAEYLFGRRGMTAYRCVFLLCVVLGGCLDTAPVWAIGETLNGLMALPNLFMLLWAGKEIRGAERQAM